MAFNPERLSLLQDAVGGDQVRVFAYLTTDPIATVLGTSYFSDITKYKLALGDIVIVRHVAGIYPTTQCTVTAVGGNSATVGGPSASIVDGSLVTAMAADGAWTNAKLGAMAALSVKANATNASAAPQDVEAGTDGHVLKRSGTSLGFGLIEEANLANRSVTFAKTVAMVEGRLAGRPASAGTGDITALTAAQARTIIEFEEVGRRKSSRAAMSTTDATLFPIIFLTESGREGTFEWVGANLTTQVTNDPGQGVFVPPASDATGASGAFVRRRDLNTVWAEWFGLTGGTVNNTVAGANATAAQRAINFTRELQAGGVILIGGYYRVNAGIEHNGNDIVFRGLNQNSGYLTTTAGIQLYKMTGSRHMLDSVFLHYNVFHSASTDYALYCDNVVKSKFKDIRVYGGYHGLVVSGTACSDTEWDGCVFNYPTGTATVYMVRDGAGINGGHHFNRCLFNLDYPAGAPTSSSQFKGEWTSATNYAVGDVVTVQTGLYRLQCTAISGLGTSGGTKPFGAGSEVWHNTNITDNLVTWRFVGRADLSGIIVDTGITWTYFEGCDITGPYYYGVWYKNSLAGDAPFDVNLKAGTTIHGPLFKAVQMDAAYQCNITIDTFGPYLASSIAVDIGAATEGVTVKGTTARGFVDGVSIAGAKARVFESEITGNTTGVRIKANVNDAKVQNNNLGTRTIGGANTTPVVIETGTGDRLNVSDNNFFGATNAISNGATGSNNVIRDNTPIS
jgi:hypothetical protein